MDDITFCMSDCQRTDCLRHPSNIQDRTIPHSYADFKETETCPEFATDINVPINNDTISRQEAIESADKIISRDDSGNNDVVKAMTAWKEFIKALPSAQTERTETHSCDYQRTETHDSRREWYMKGYRDAQRWIPFKTRPLTDEEKKEYPYYVDMLDCQLPENGQRILVNVKCNGHESVQMDEYYDDDGSYLDSGYEIVSEATAWMPLPEPYKEEE